LSVRGGRHFYLTFDVRALGRFRQTDLNDLKERSTAMARSACRPWATKGGFLLNFGVGGFI